RDAALARLVDDEKVEEAGLEGEVRPHRLTSRRPSPHIGKDRPIGLLPAARRRRVVHVDVDHVADVTVPPENALRADELEQSRSRGKPSTLRRRERIKVRVRITSTKTAEGDVGKVEGLLSARPVEDVGLGHSRTRGRGGADQDRKSTRLNSSHVKISYAVFCL